MCVHIWNSKDLATSINSSGSRSNSSFSRKQEYIYIYILGKGGKRKANSASNSAPSEHTALLLLS